MRAAVLALALLAASASAQDGLHSDAGLQTRPSANERVTMVAAGLAVSLGSFALGADLDEGGWLVLAAPFTSGMTVYLVGGMQGHDGSLLATLGGATAGAAAGVGVLLLNRNALQFDGTDAEFAGFLLGVGMYAVLPPIGAMMGYTATASPTVLTTPDGEPVPGVALRLAL